MIKKLICILLICLGINFRSDAQETEVGVWLGMANYFGDLNPVFSHKEMRWAGGAFYRYNLNPRMSVRAGLNYGRIKATDAVIKKVPYPQTRNLSFESDILEMAVTYELNFFRYQPAKGKIFTPYIFVGVGVFYFSPFTRINGNKTFLQQVGTEGQNTPFGEENKYARYSVSIPYGGGIRYAINRNWGINAEVSARRTFSDYIDDVSSNYIDPEVLGSITADIADQSAEGLLPGKQRGTAKDVDRFIFYGVAVTYTIQTIKCPTIYKREF